MEEEIEELERDMTPILLEDLGMRFTSDTQKYKARFGLYQCQYCGKEFETGTARIKSGHTQSCGCFKKQMILESNSSHNCAYHPLYNTWKQMKARCYNPKANGYARYGGRGITICERWLDVRNFIEDVYPSFSKGLTLDRIDVNGNYEPDNFRWVNRSIQAQNTRESTSTNTSGYRGVSWEKRRNTWTAQITANNKRVYLGSFKTALEAAKAYERYVRLNNLEHNFTPALTPEEIEEINKQKEEQYENNIQN